MSLTMPYTNALLRAMLVAEDITMVKEGITKDKCYVVQHYAYSSQRDRVGSLMMSGVEDSSFIDLVIRIADSGTAKQFYQQMTESEPFAYSILFNASFNANERLTGFDDAIMVKGFIVDIEEIINTSALDTQDDTQVLMKVRLLLSTITYLGNRACPGCA